jgi:hypothetical protein
MTTPGRTDEKDHYATLGVAPDATPKEITSAYRDLALLHHPDRNPDDPSAVDRFRQVSAAHHELSNDTRRQHYDLARLGELPAAPVRHRVVSFTRGRIAIVAGLAAVIFAASTIIGSWDRPVSHVPIPRVVSARSGMTIAYTFQPVECGPGGWSGVITNTDSVPFSGDVTAVATRDGAVVARVQAPVVDLDPGRSVQLQFSWNAADVTRCAVESVIQH